MKNILIATDFSKEAYSALYYATQLFKEDNRYYIVNFLGDEIHTSVYSYVNEEELGKIPKLRQSSELKCMETFHQIVRDSGFNGDHFEIITSENKVVPGITEMIQSHAIDVVVMGTRKHSGLLHSAVGTYTTRIIKKAIPVPLLIIPREIEFSAPKNIAFASELTHDFNANSLAILRDIALMYNSRITLVHDGDETDTSSQQWNQYNAFKNFFEGLRVNLEFYPSHQEVSYTISRFIKEKNMHLLAMEYNKHTPGGWLFREPIVEKIDRHLSFPLLVFPQKQKLLAGNKN